jgi:hypothetical protein
MKKEIRKSIYNCNKWEGIKTIEKYKFAKVVFGKYELIQVYTFPNLVKPMGSEIILNN